MVIDEECAIGIIEATSAATGVGGLPVSKEVSWRHTGINIAASECAGISRERR
jgi:hypothetical protein